MAAATSSRKKSGRAAAAAAGTAAAGAARWTESQVQTLMNAVNAADTAKAGFAVAAGELGKSVGTVQQKYYALQRAAGGGRKGRNKSAASGSRSGPARATTSGLPGPAQLRVLTVDQLTALAQQVKTEVDRRRVELDRAAKLFG